MSGKNIFLFLQIVSYAIYAISAENLDPTEVDRFILKQSRDVDIV